MKKAGLAAVALILLLQTLAFVPGCGGETPGIDEEVVMFAIEKKLIASIEKTFQPI